MQEHLSASLQPLKVFISSRQTELANERAYVKSHLRQHGIESFAFEFDTKASPTSPERTFLEALGQSDIYLGIFYRQYSEATITEYREACKLGIPCLIYIKKVGRQKRDRRLKGFLDSISNKHVYREFDLITQLSCVYDDVLQVLANSLRTLRVSIIEPRPSQLFRLASTELRVLNIVQH